MRFTDRVREELAHVPPGDACCARAELSAALRLGATFVRRGGEPDGFALAFESTSGAVVRRVHRGLRALAPIRPELAVREAGGLRAARAYRLTVPAAAGSVLEDLAVVDGRGRPRHALPRAPTRRACDRAAYLRGALLVAGSVSDPARAAHLEIRIASEHLAAGLVGLLHASGAPGARSAAHRDAWRVVVKDGAQIADLLAATGAHTAFLAFDHDRLRRELRGAANRAANADRANLARSVAAAGRQAADIERVVEQVGWEALDPELRAVALVRIANPEASLAELGSLLDPPIGKAAVHRRLQRLRALGAEAGEPPP